MQLQGPTALRPARHTMKILTPDFCHALTSRFKLQRSSLIRCQGLTCRIVLTVFRVSSAGERNLSASILFNRSSSKEYILLGTCDMRQA